MHVVLILQFRQPWLFDPQGRTETICAAQRFQARNSGRRRLRVLAQSEVALDARRVSNTELDVIEFSDRSAAIEGFTLDKDSARGIERRPCIFRPELVERLDHGTVEVAQQRII